MNMKKKKQWRRLWRLYRDYFLGFSFIVSIMMLAFTIDLVKALSHKPAKAEPTKEAILLSYESVNPEDFVSGFSLALISLSKDNVSVVWNDNEMVTSSYEEKVKNDSKKKDKDAESKSSVSDEKNQLEYNLAKLIDAEGSVVDDYSQQLIAYCFLNRMRSNHWENTFEGVLNDGRGYAERTCEYVADPRNTPSERALKNARICLRNHYADTMPVPYNLVFQSGFRQGPVYYYDESHGMYFCISEKLKPN